MKGLWQRERLNSVPLVKERETDVGQVWRRANEKKEARKSPSMSGIKDGNHR